jgi:hypothetical protein
MTKLSARRLCSILLATVMGLMSARNASGQPAIREISPRGLRIGETTTVTISGGQLSGGVRLISNVPIASQQVLEGATADQVKIAVNLAPGLLPGIGVFHLVDAKGISEPVMLGVDRLPQLPFSDRVDAKPVSLSGAIAGEAKLSTTFTGRRGEEISIDLECRRLGGAMKPVIRLLDANGSQLAYSAGREALEGDARLTAELPADGEYRVEFHDLLLRAPPSPFRLKLGRLMFADAIFPPELAADTEAELEFFARGKSWGVKSHYRAGSAHPLAVASWRPEALTGVTPVVAVATTRQVLEPVGRDPAAPLDAGAAPVGIAGKLLAPQEIDRYLVAVTAGARHRFELHGARLRSPIDGQIIVRNEQGAELARGDDQPGTSDPAVEVDVPMGAGKLLIEVRDTQGGGGEGYTYQLVATSLAAPHVALTTDLNRVVVPRGGLVVAPVRIGRRNYAGGLTFALESLPAGISVAAADAPADSEIALVAFSATADASGAGISRVLAKSTAADAGVVSEVVRPGLVGPAAEHQPQLKREFAIAAVDAAPLALTWQRADVDLLGDTKAVRCFLKIEKRGEVPGKTRIRLMSSQVQPKKKIKENNQDKEVDDVEKTLRLEGETAFASDAGEVMVTLRVPADLPPRLWQVAFVAEVLSADEKAVTASAPCLPRTMKLGGQ